MNRVDFDGRVGGPQADGKLIIYDIGANNGDDIPYYLKKADLVVAVEANTALCRLMSRRFSIEISQGKLIVENCVLTSGQDGETVPFYINKVNTVLSQFPPPQTNQDDFERVFLVGKSVTRLFADYGFPFYVKIDIEGYDHILLRSIFNSRIVPAYISAEAHSIEVFLLLAALGGYNSFKLVNGLTVEQDYRHHLITTVSGHEIYSFPRHSAGPFGEDVTGHWINTKSLFRRLLSEGLGWKDIHAKVVSQSSQQVRSNGFWRVKYWLYKINWFAAKAIRKLDRTLSADQPSSL